jgi:CheY-like chemotaxis protein
MDFRLFSGKSRNTGPLSGYAFLIVEDEPFQAQLISDLIDSMGGTVRKMALTFEQARLAVDQTAFDCAILDINLGGTLSFRIADLLQMRGTPFIFCTAYADAVDVYPGAARAPRLDKPVDESALLAAVLQVLDPEAAARQ